MLKIRLAFIISIIAASLTIIFGILSGIGIVALAYRTLVSIAVLGVLGYLLGFAIDSFLIDLTNKSKTKGQKIDITAKDDVLFDNEMTSFSPLNPDIYEKISTDK